MNGWAKTYRQRFDNPIWRNEPFCKGYAWDWLCGNACWQPTDFNIQGRTVELKRGQICITVRQLCEEFKWSRGSVMRFLTRLKTETMIETESGTGKTTGRTIITICNYGKFQDTDPDDPADAGTTSGTTSGTILGQGWDINKDSKTLRKESTSDSLDLKPTDPPAPTPFETFWNEYPRKGSKKDAEKAFKAAVKKAPLDLIVAGAINYAKHHRAKDTENEYLKLAGGWLRGEMWGEWQGHSQEVPPELRGFEHLVGKGPRPG